jgi:hypothetical protein
VRKPRSKESAGDSRVFRGIRVLAVCRLLARRSHGCRNASIVNLFRSKRLRCNPSRYSRNRQLLRIMDGVPGPRQAPGGQPPGATWSGIPSAARSLPPCPAGVGDKDTGAGRNGKRGGQEVRSGLICSDRGGVEAVQRSATRRTLFAATIWQQQLARRRRPRATLCRLGRPRKQRPAPPK